MKGYFQKTDFVSLQAFLKLALLILFIPCIYGMAPSSFFEDILSDRMKEKDILIFFKRAPSGISVEKPVPLLERLCEEGRLCKVFAENKGKIDCFYFYPENLPDAKLVAYHPSWGAGFVLERDLGIQDVKSLTEDVPIDVKKSHYLKEMVQNAFDSGESTLVIKAYNEFLKYADEEKIDRAQEVMKKMLQEKAEFPFVLTSFLQYDMQKDRYSSLLTENLWNTITVIHDKIKEIEAFEFIPELHRSDGFSYQNFLHCLIQISELNGMAYPDLLLLSLLNIAEKSRMLPDDEESKKIKDRLAMVYSPLAERLGLTGIADSFRDSSLSRKSRNALLGAIKKVYGREYDELETYLFEHMKPLVESALEGKVFSYKINARIKTLFSLKEKLESQLDKFVIRGYSEKELKEAYIKVLENMGTGINEKGKSQAIFDLLGLQVVFDIHPLIRDQHVGLVNNKKEEIGQSFIFEIQNTIKSLIRGRIGQEVAKDKGKNSGKRAVFIEKDKTLDKNGYIETKIMASWIENEKMYRSEIQVMNNMDYAIQRHGSIAHWKYKIRDTGFSIDNDILNRLQFTLTSNYREDFKLLAKEISQDIYITVRQYGEGYNGELHYLRLPAGSVAADAVSSRTLNYPSLKVDGIERQESPAMLDLSAPLYPGDQLSIRSGDFTRDLSALEFKGISQKAKKIRTKLLALNLSPRQGEFEQIKKEFSKIVDSNTMLEGMDLYDFIQSSLRLKDKNEIFLLAFAVNANTSFLLDFALNYMKETLGMKMDSLSEEDMDSFFLYPSEKGLHRGKKNLHIFSRILLSELTGKKILEKAIGTDFDLDAEKNARLEYVVKKLGLNDTSELYPRLAFRRQTLEEILLFNNHAFSTHKLVIQQKGQIQDQAKDKILKMIKEFGYIFEYASRIHRTNEAIEIDLLIPSLTMEGEDGRKAYVRERETRESVYHQVVEKLDNLFGTEEVDISIGAVDAPLDAELYLDYKEFKLELKRLNAQTPAAYNMTSEDYEQLLKSFFKKYNIPFVFRSASNSGISCKLILNERDNLIWLKKNLALFLAEQIFPSRMEEISKSYSKILFKCIHLARNTFGRDYLFKTAA